MTKNTMLRLKTSQFVLLRLLQTSPQNKYWRHCLAVKQLRLIYSNVNVMRKTPAQWLIFPLWINDLCLLIICLHICRQLWTFHFFSSFSRVLFIILYHAYLFEQVWFLIQPLFIFLQQSHFNYFCYVSMQTQDFAEYNIEYSMCGISSSIKVTIVLDPLDVIFQS